MSAQPTSIKKTKDVSRKDILLSVARVPKTSRLFAGSSDFKVYELDLAAAKPELGELVGHQSYVTGVALAGDSLVSGSYDQKLIWWDREKRTPIAHHRERPRQVDSRRRRLAGRQPRRQRRRRHGLPCLGREDRCKAASS